MKKTFVPLGLTLASLAYAIPAYAQTNLGITKPANAKITDIGKLITSGVNVLLIVAGILVFVFLVWGGIQWLTSGGDKNSVEQARNRITHALIGLAIIAAAWALSMLITNFFGLDAGLKGNINLPKPY